MSKIKNELILACLILILSTIEARGGGGGGRGGGRGGSSGRSRGSSGSSWGGSRMSFSSSGRSSKFGGSQTFGGSHVGHQNNGGWFHGFFQSSPYHYAPRPVYISRPYNAPPTENAKSYSYDTENSTGKPEVPVADTHSFKVGLAINKALSNDFFSIFNMAHDISEYLEEIKNPIIPAATTTMATNSIAATETTTTSTTTSTIMTTTEETPVPTYDLNSYNSHLDSAAQPDIGLPLKDILAIVKSLNIEESPIPPNYFSSSENFIMENSFDLKTASIKD